MTILGIKETCTEGTDPVRAFELLLCSPDSELVSHGGERKKKYVVLIFALKFTEVVAFLIISVYFAFEIKLGHKAAENRHKQTTLSYSHINYFLAGSN